MTELPTFQLEILRLLQREIAKLQTEKLLAQIQDNVRHAREVQSKWPKSRTED
jgi:hypothetical protein